MFHPNVTRDQICEELWGDIDNTKARNQLRVCLSHLTQLLNNKETKILFVEKKQISLSDEVQCDLLILLQKIKKAIEEKNNKIKEEIISELFFNLDQNIFRNLNEDWNLHIRIKIEIQLIELANNMSELLIAQGKLLDAISYLKFVLIFNPEEYSTYMQISHLYERNHQNAEAQKWRVESERLIFNS
ncbi:hypothetical protein H1230_14825 [Paenibacillus sp. 19GGS1-52]|uniref:tetratricopeptide repeat protein n=1 Tax=Paenibacillus sp. 19GGS1-52 TaxID=2758563 RepID=UPI001EFB194A|nr:hypothetical protein [Paenibacillus sp. 19GGS1-52]ULO09924.1 hypothetical protein H1230_14825 [Paenibacillus sp. 19GGS1-52]